MTNAMKRLILLFVGLVGLALVGKAQGVEEELGFKYVKAKYLIETERYEDAIKAFTQIVKEDATYEEALLLRAEAKYAMGAYQGTKNDVLEHFKLKGANDKAILLLGKADYKLGNMDAALSTLLVATGAVSPDADIYEIIGSIYKADGKLLKACDFWAEGARLGSTKCETQSRKVCGSTAPTTSTPSRSNTNTGGLGSPKKNDDLGSGTEPATGMDEKTKVDRPTTQSEGSTDESSETTSTADDSKPSTPVDSNLPPDDDTPNDIVVDEDLTISIYGNALGKRRVLDQPNILIMSNDVGLVAMDICVNKRGKVESAELNTELSTIEKPSLISLAVRRAKDFWFEKNDYKEQCGVMVFKITGG